MDHVINNFKKLSTNSNRKDALSIIEAGSNAVDTPLVISNTVTLEEGVLTIKGNTFNLNSYERVFIIGFGKASCKAVQSLEDVLGDRLTGGIVIDKNPSPCRIAEVYKGTHPLSSKENVEATEKIVNMAQGATENDFVIVVVSGGGSALLSYPLSELEQSNRLYQAFLHTGGTIEELNTLRKHISEIKGGGLTKMLYPATVASLILCDVPGNHFGDTASGPTYLDESTIESAEKIVKKYSLPRVFTFNDTPKDEIYFKKVTNIPFVSNIEALKAMSEMGESLGYEVISLGDEVYDAPNIMLEKMCKVIKPNSVVIAGGELALTLKKEGGIGGRNLFICAQALDFISDDSVFIAFASDGIDNLSISAGAIVDIETKNKIKEKNLSYLRSADKDMCDELFSQTGDNIITGPTGNNVSDLYIMLKK